MDEKKQIEEMASTIYTFLRSDTMSRALASLLYGEGFRKQTDIVKEFATEIEKYLEPYELQEGIYSKRAYEKGDMCDYQIHQYGEHIIGHMFDFIAELEKKYTEEGK